MKVIVKISFVFILLCFIKNVLPVPISTKANFAILMDYETGNVLFDKNPNSRIFPASMSKLLTLYILFEFIKDGTFELDETFNVSKKAWKKGGSKMFLEEGTQVKVEDLLRGIIVQSGNDACIVVAEAISGDEASFANLMNKKAKELGLKNSNFVNSTGWPDPNHYMTAKDLAILSKRIIQDFPEFFYLFNEKYYTYNNIKQSNRNPLLYNYKYSDGLKTGYTEESGFSLSSTAQKRKTRLILVLSGLDSDKDRKTESIKLFEWAFREFKNIKLFSKEETIMEADVWLGEKPIIELYSKEDVLFTIKRENLKNYSAKLVYSNPISAPVIRDKEYARLIISKTINKEKSYPLYSKDDVKKAGIFRKITSAFSYLLFGGYAE